MVAEDLRTIGVIGVTNLSVLAALIIWRTIRFLQISHRSKTNHNFKKYILFHLCLLLAPCLDLPMYIGFLVLNRYTTSLYSFHRLSAASLFAAYSITILDWSKVLKDIEKDTIYPFMRTRLRSIHYFSDVSLLIINVVFIGLSLANFIYIFIVNDLDIYLKSYVYITALYVQVAASLLLTCCMLFAGMKLYFRILGVSGAFGGSSTHGQTGMSHSSATELGVTKEFRSALRSLNFVMATCSLCIFIQMLLLILNYALGYASRTSVYVGPFFFYWTFYSWVPLWGPICALLYLSRNGYARERKPQNSNLQPLILNDDLSTSNVILARNSSSTTDEDSRSTRLSKPYSEDQYMGMVTGGESYSIGNPDSGNLFFSDELMDIHSDNDLSYMHGNSRYASAERLLYQSSGLREFVVNTPQDSDEKLSRSTERI